MERILVGLLAAVMLMLCGCGIKGSSYGPDNAETSDDGSGSTDENVNSTLKVYCFSAGKADAILIWTDKSSVLIDTGESGFGKKIVNFLKENGIDSLNYLILTHFDQDHVGGAAKVLKSVNVEKVLQSDYPKDSDEYRKYLDAAAAAKITPTTVGETYEFTLDGAKYTVYPPAESDYATDPSNNSSLIISVNYGEKSFLFSGDAETDRLKEFLAENDESYNFLKVPYHGHWQEELPQFITEVSPEYAVICCSDDEPEDSKTVSELTSAGAEVFVTRTSPVLAECDGKSLTVNYADT